MFILSNLAQNSDGGGGIDLEGFLFCFLISNLTENFDYVSWVNVLFYMSYSWYTQSFKTRKWATQKW